MNPNINDYLKGLRTLSHIRSKTDEVHEGDMWDLLGGATHRVLWAILKIIQEERRRRVK